MMTMTTSRPVLGLLYAARARLRPYVVQHEHIPQTRHHALVFCIAVQRTDGAPTTTLCGTTPILTLLQIGGKRLEWLVPVHPRAGNSK